MNSWHDELRSAKRLVRICVLIALVLVGIGVGELLAEPRMPSRHGVGAMLRRWLYGLFGTAGLWAFWVALAVPPLALARLVWRATPRPPGERWWRR